MSEEINMDEGEQRNTVPPPSSKIQTLEYWYHWVKILFAIAFLISTIYFFFAVSHIIHSFIIIAYYYPTYLLAGCTTKNCAMSISANTFLQNMNESVDPCEDFFMFSCGGYINSNDTEDDQYFTFTPIKKVVASRLKYLLEEVDDKENFKLAKTLYKSCLNQEAKSNHERVLQKSLDDIGLEWPVLSENKYNQSEHPLWDERIYKIKQFGLSGDYLMSFSIQGTFNNITLHQIHIDPPEFGLDRVYFVNGTEETELESYYNEQLETVDRLINYNYEVRPSQKNNSDGAKEKSISSIIHFEMNLANATLSSTDKHDVEQLYHKIKISELEMKYPMIPWVKYINTMLTIGKAPLNITTNDTIIISEPKYFAKLNDLLLQHENDETIANYIMWRAVNDIRKLLEHGNESLGWNSCVDEVTTNFPSLVRSMYIQRYYDKTIEPNVLEIKEFVWKEFLKSINQTDWLIPETKEKVYQKLEALTSSIGSLGFNHSKTEAFQGLEMNETHYIQNILNLTKFQFNYSWWRADKENVVTVPLYEIPADVSAYCYHEYNNIVVSASLLQGFVYNKLRPMYINYGTLGSTIAHEIGHTLDEMGIQYDIDGHASNWWDVESKTAFRNRAQCLIEQYGNYTVPEVGLNVNGANTVGENIADNLGMIAAYKAYQSWVLDHEDEKILPGLKYTANQLFWISAANFQCSKSSPTYQKSLMLTDGHSPSEFRIIGSVSNSVDFSRDFNCPLGSKMNPIKKCTMYGQ